MPGRIAFFPYVGFPTGGPPTVRPRFVHGVEHGKVVPDGEISVVRDRGAAATIDGGSRLGPVVAAEAMDGATVRAAEFGVGAVGVHNGNHVGMLGYYTDHARRAGFVGVGLTNTEPAMPPFGGVEAVLGTTPIAIGVPTDPPFNLHMSTAAISRGDVAELQLAGEALPEGVALSADGAPTTGPTGALDGLILSVGGAKGAVLAIAVEISAGGLVGAAMGADVTGTHHTEDTCRKGDPFVAVDPTVLGGNGFIERVTAFVRELKAVDRERGVDEICLPGERSMAADRSADVVDLGEDLWDDPVELAKGN